MCRCERSLRLQRFVSLWSLPATPSRLFALYKQSDRMPTSSGRLPAMVVNAAFSLYRALYVRIAWLLSLTQQHIDRSPESSAPPDSEGIVYSLNVGRGIPKRPVERCYVTHLGVLGDAQVQPYVRPWGGHGGEKKAVMLWSLEVIEQISGEGHPLCKPGRCGEQVTISGVDWALVKTGARIQLGQHVLLEATYMKGPCHQQEPNFTDAGDGIQRISADRHPDDSRVHTRVLRAGYVSAGDKVQVWRSPRATSGAVVRCSSDPGNFISKEYDH